MQKGSGITLDAAFSSFSGALSFFIRESTCRILSTNSRGGILLKLKLNAGVDSPYISTSSNDVGRRVDEIILKLIYLHDTEEFILRDPSNSVELVIQNNTKLDDFKNEVNTQIDIYTQSLDIYLEPICPAVVCAHTFKNDNSSLPAILDKLISNSIDEGDNMPILYFNKIKQFISKNRRFHIGVIAMESFTNTRTLKNIVDDTSIPQTFRNTYKCMALYEICRLYNIGYLHGDMHMNNILFDINYNYFNGTIDPVGTEMGYNPGLRGRAILIDFGSSFQHGQGIIDVSHNLEQLGEFNFYDRYITRSIMLPSPKYPAPYVGLPAYENWPSYQWQRMPEMPDKKFLNIKLFFLTLQRKTTKMVFNIHLNVRFIGVQRLHPTMIGGQIVGKNSNQQIINMEPTMTQISEKLDPKISIQQIKNIEPTIMTQISEKNNTNIFDKLDPKHILTVPFVEDYIKKQNDFCNDILKEMEFKETDFKEMDFKGGYNKRKTTKKRKTKKNKNK